MIPCASSGDRRGRTEWLILNSSMDPERLFHLCFCAQHFRAALGKHQAQGWWWMSKRLGSTCKCHAPMAGCATIPKSPPRTADARSGHPSFGHSSPASGSWSAGPSGSPAPWCSPGGGGTGCPGSALARWRLSAHAHRRETELVPRLRSPFPLLLLPKTLLVLHIES